MIQSLKILRTVCSGGRDEACTCGEEYMTNFKSLQLKFEECGTVCCAQQFSK
jgi:hypothetical protein